VFSTGDADALDRDHARPHAGQLRCPEESAVTFIHGPREYKALGQQLHDDHDTSQIAAAFLLTHPVTAATCSPPPPSGPTRSWSGWTRTRPG
jgi:hypothetical protein